MSPANVIRYDHLPFDYLTRIQARDCFKAFVRGVKNALDELHSLGVSHNDVWLENVLFNSEYVPVLIDLERAHKVSPFFGDKSCMYNLKPFGKDFNNGRKTDYYQLGWMAAWIIDESSVDYHSRKWSERSLITENKFIVALITKGIFSDQFYSEIPPDKNTIEYVLRTR